MSNVFVDYYRCPDEFGEFEMPLGATASAGFFTFGGSMCYGRQTAAIPSLSSALPDLSSDVTVHAGHVRLPFDLSEVVTNLREERYQSGGPKAGKLIDSSLSRALYYLIRPALPVSVRKHLQRVHLNGWKRIPFPAWPVDATVESLMKQTMALATVAHDSEPIPFIWFWPDGARGCSIITHDVEAAAGRDFCDTLMDVDQSYGFKSSFQIVPERRYTGARALAIAVRDRGFEVNVHDLNHDGRLFVNWAEFVSRAARINHYGREFNAVGFRSAAMYRSQDWLKALKFSYDMSVPNVAHLEPQRGGCCTVMPYFIGDTLELPLTTVQDYSLFHILDDYTIAVWKEQIGLILGEHGLISILTHPDYLIEPRACAVYKELLGYLAGLRSPDRVWFALPSEVNTWWRNRSRMRLVAEGASWRIEGPDSDRARLAHAVLDGNRVVYRVS